jgi:hypothetical protein
MLALRQKDAYDNKRADLLVDRGAQRVSTQMVSKTAAEAASKITSTGGPITQYTSVNKRGNVGGKKKLRGGSTNERTIVSQWTRTNRFKDKIDLNGKPYRIEYLVCKAKGCRKQREQKVNADGTLHTNTGNLAKHYRKDHAKIHSQTSMRTVMLTASDGKVERATSRCPSISNYGTTSTSPSLFARTLRYFAREIGMQWRTSCRTSAMGTNCQMNAP